MASNCTDDGNGCRVQSEVAGSSATCSKADSSWQSRSRKVHGSRVAKGAAAKREARLTGVTRVLGMRISPRHLPQVLKGKGRGT